MNRRRRIGFGLALALLTAGAVVAVAELSVRLFLDGAMDYGLEMWKYARRLKRVARDPRLGHEHVPDRSARLMGVEVRINSKGLRDREFDYERTPGTRRILMLGDSLTLGWGVALDDTTAKQLERRLNREPGGVRFEVINAGVGNYNTQMEVDYFFEEGVKYRPDVVVLNYFINDAEERPVYRGNFWNEHFESYVYLAGRLDILRRMVGGDSMNDWSGYYESLYREGAPGWSAARASIGRLGEHCRARGIECLLVSYPELHDLRRYRFRSVGEQVVAAAREAGLGYLDLLGAVAGEDERALWVAPDDPHPNARADALYAAAIHERLRAAAARR